MSLDHKPKMRWHISGFIVILCKYELLLKKLLAMSVREVIWAVSFDLLLKLDPYINVDDTWVMIPIDEKEIGPWIRLLK